MKLEKLKAGQSGARKSDGHTDTCRHPGAVAARKRAAKAVAL